MKIGRRHFLGVTAAAAGATLAQAQPPATPAVPAADDAHPGRTPHTRFAANLELWWRNLPFLQRIERAARLGYPAIEFWPWRGKDIGAIADACRRLNLQVGQFTAWGFSPGLNNPRNHDHFVREITASCEIARRLNCRLMCVVAGDDVPGMTQRQMHDHVIAGLRRAAPIAERNNVTLILEPMNIRVDHRGHCLYGSAPAMRILEAVGSTHVKMLYDAYHMQITEGDLCGHLRECMPRIGYVQIGDTPGRHEPGTGEIHYQRVLRQLHELGYRGYVGLEHTPSRDELAAARACAHADRW